MATVNEWLELDWPEEWSGVDWSGGGGKACTPVPCHQFEAGGLVVEPWIPTVDELRQAGGPIGQPDGSYYLLRDGEVTHVTAADPDYPAGWLP